MVAKPGIEPGTQGLTNSMAVGLSYTPGNGGSLTTLGLQYRL